MNKFDFIKKVVAVVVIASMIYIIILLICKIREVNYVWKF